MIVGTKVGPFTVEKELGSGAMGTVYLAQHGETGQRVAMKVVTPGLGSSKTAQARFQREAEILKQLKHRNIVRLVGVGKIRGSPFYAMEFVQGESMDHVLSRRKRLGWEEVVDLGRQLCAALQHAHENGIVHRDLKPSNLMMLPDGTLKLMDFGIAKDLDVTQITATNSTVGTAAYMSPEQCRGAKEITSKSDLYSLGVVLYELLTGHKPFHAESVMEMFVKHTKEAAPRPSRRVMDIPIWLDTLITHLMEKEPEKRPYNADIVAKALADVKEKAQTQVSAGVTAAKSRKVDRSEHMTNLDATDMEAARTLLGKKKKKKKEDNLPIYQKKWFQAVCMSAGLVVIACVFYRAFLYVPSADALRAEAAHLKATDFRAAREGPIRLFLAYYPKDQHAFEVQGWADQYDRELLERQVYNRHSLVMKFEGKWDEIARDALDKEEAGRFKDAAARWGELTKFKEVPNSQDRAWGLLAADHLAQLERVDDLDDRLGTMSSSEKGKDGLEALALKAKRASTKSEKEGYWQDLKDETKNKKEQHAERQYYLLAAKNLYLLRPKNE